MLRIVSIMCQALAPRETFSPLNRFFFKRRIFFPFIWQLFKHCRWEDLRDADPFRDWFTQKGVVILLFFFFFLRRGHAQVKREESARGKTSARGKAPRLSRLTPGTFLYPPKKRKNDPCTTGC